MEDQAATEKPGSHGRAVQLAKFKGPALHARATLLSGAEAERAAQALARRHPLLQGLLVPLMHRLMRYRTLRYELSSVGPRLS